MTREQKIAKLTANCSCEKSKATINGLSEETLDVLVSNVLSTKDDPETEAAERKKKEVEDAKNILKRNGFAVTENSVGGANGLTPEQLAVMNYGQQALNRDKANLVNRLTANISDTKQKEEATKFLMNKGLPELQTLASLVPVQNHEAIVAAHTPAPITFLGAGDPMLPAQPLANAASLITEVKEDSGWMPTLNFQELAKLPDRYSFNGAAK